MSRAGRGFTNPGQLKTFLAALKACGRSRDLEGGKRFYLEALDSGYASNIYVATTAIDMYAKCGSMPDARHLFDSMLHHDVAAWNTLILGYVENGENERALELFTYMQHKGFQPNARSFLAALMACANLATKEEARLVQEKLLKPQALEKGVSLHSQARKLSCDSDSFVATTLVDMYAKCGSFSEAKNVFERIARPNVVSWTVFILGCTENGEAALALETFDRMVHSSTGCAPDAQAFVAALAACGSVAEKESSTHVEGKFLKLSCLERAMSLHSAAVKNRSSWNVFVASSLLDVYAKCGSMGDARRVFDKLASHDLVTWTALIRGYAENRDAMLALELFSRLKTSGFSPDAQALVAALTACNNVVGLETGKRIHGEIFRHGYETDTIVSNCSVDFYGKCGSMASAQRVFDSYATKRNVVTWNALLAGYSHQGETDTTFNLFHKMCEEEVQATAITFLCLLTACSHVGLVSKGEEYFETMSSRYGVSRDLQHYTCMVDILGRANHLERALEFVKAMPLKADAVTWTTLLSACRKWKNVEVGKLAFDTLLGFDKTQGAYYVLMANIYGSVGMWEERGKVLEGRRTWRAWKEVGESWWSDEDGVVHRFTARDRRHPQTEEINVKLKELLVEMKERGYVADVVSVMEEQLSNDEKEDSLCGHSERLAIACALVNTPPGRNIRVVKNLRVCDDCHRATRLISQIEKRVIVCRDSSRFHVFAHGKCSCNDFW